MDVNIEELLSSKRDLSEEEFNENPELSYLVGDYGFNAIRGKIFIADDWYILDQVILDSRANKIITYRFNQPSCYNINFVDYIKNTKTKILFNNCILDCSPVADTAVEINTDVVFNNCIDTNNGAKAIHGYIFKKGVYLNNSNIDFTDCTFEDNFKCENANFDVNFSRSKFLKNFTFHLSQSHNINFESAQFNANTSFKVDQKIISANFYQAKFKNTVSFSLIRFGDSLVDFSKAEFNKVVSFYKCAFDGETKFNSTIFGDIAKFTRATFNNVVNFDKTNFKDESRFYKTQFSKTAILKETKFKNKANFSNSVFNEKAYFTNAVFEAHTDFSSATFADEARFFNADFKGTTIFENTKFEGKADFKTDKNLAFGKDVNFGNTTFQESTYFNNRIFDNFVDFHEGDFKRVVCFYGAVFKKPVNFSSIVFNGALNFVNAKTNFTYDELKNFIKDKSTNNIDKCINVTNDFRDGFRLMKHALNNKGNALDASLFHRLELYCKELELEFALEDIKAKNSKTCNEVKAIKEPKDTTKNKNSIELFFDLITLKLYRNTSDHHTNLLKIINFAILTIVMYGLSFWILDDFLLKAMINSPKILMLLLLFIFLIGLLTCLLYFVVKYKILWVTVPIGIVTYVSFITPGLVNAFDNSIYVIVFILLYVTLYALSFYLFRFSFVRFMTYLVFMAIFLDKPVLITPFIGIFTSERIAESKFEEYIVKYNNNSLDDMLLDANFTNIKAENKINFIAKNRKIILERLDNSRTHTPLIDFVKKYIKCSKESMDHNASCKILHESTKKTYEKALNALKYDEAMQSIQKSANLLYAFIMLLIVYSLTKTARRNSIVPS